MGIAENLGMFCMGGAAYVTLELLWRGWSHGSMFLAGGLCLILVGQLNEARPKLPWPLRILAGALIITMVELAFGLLFNRQYRVWDYRGQRGNFCGQICLGYSLLWLPVSAAALGLNKALRHCIRGCKDRNGKRD